MPRQKTVKRKRLQRVSVRAEHHEEPDWDRFAWALLQYARVLAEETSGEGTPEP